MEHPDLTEELATAARRIDADVPRIPGGFSLRNGGMFRPVGPLEGLPEDRGPHVLERIEE